MIEDTIPQEIEPPTIKQKAIAVPEKLRPIFLNNYERYEYLMREGCTSVEERKWMSEYKQSEEYKQIYEE
jgi:hypothetical protein